MTTVSLLSLPLVQHPPVQTDVQCLDTESDIIILESDQPNPRTDRNDVKPGLLRKLIEENADSNRPPGYTFQSEDPKMLDYDENLIWLVYDFHEGVPVNVIEIRGANTINGYDVFELLKHIAPLEVRMNIKGVNVTRGFNKTCRYFKNLFMIIKWKDHMTSAHTFLEVKYPDWEETKTHLDLINLQMMQNTELDFYDYIAPLMATCNFRIRKPFVQKRMDLLAEERGIIVVPWYFSPEETFDHTKDVNEICAIIWGLAQFHAKFLSLDQDEQLRLRTIFNDKVISQDSIHQERRQQIMSVEKKHPGFLKGYHTYIKHFTEYECVRKYIEEHHDLGLPEGIVFQQWNQPGLMLDQDGKTIIFPSCSDFFFVHAGSLTEDISHITLQNMPDRKLRDACDVTLLEGFCSKLVMNLPLTNPARSIYLRQVDKSIRCMDSNKKWGMICILPLLAMKYDAQMELMKKVNQDWAVTDEHKNYLKHVEGILEESICYPRDPNNGCRPDPDSYNSDEVVHRIVRKSEPVVQALTTSWFKAYLMALQQPNPNERIGISLLQALFFSYAAPDRKLFTGTYDRKSRDSKCGSPLNAPFTSRSPTSPKGRISPKSPGQPKSPRKPRSPKSIVQSKSSVFKSPRLPVVRCGAKGQVQFPIITLDPLIVTLE